MKIVKNPILSDEFPIFNRISLSIFPYHIRSFHTRSSTKRRRGTITIDHSISLSSPIF